MSTNTKVIKASNAVEPAAPAKVWGMTPTMRGKTTNASIKEDKHHA